MRVRSMIFDATCAVLVHTFWLVQSFPLYGAEIMQIRGNVFIVTGGASGLGGATSRLLASEGGHVVIADLQADKGEALARELGAKTRFVRCDVSSETDGKATVAAASELGSLRGLIVTLTVISLYAPKMSLTRTTKLSEPL